MNATRIQVQVQDTKGASPVWWITCHWIYNSCCWCGKTVDVFFLVFCEFFWNFATEFCCWKGKSVCHNRSCFGDIWMQFSSQQNDTWAIASVFFAIFNSIVNVNSVHRKLDWILGLKENLFCASHFELKQFLPCMGITKTQAIVDFSFCKWPEPPHEFLRLSLHKMVPWYFNASKGFEWGCSGASMFMWQTVPLATGNTPDWCIAIKRAKKPWLLNDERTRQTSAHPGNQTEGKTWTKDPRLTLSAEIISLFLMS